MDWFRYDPGERGELKNVSQIKNIKYRQEFRACVQKFTYLFVGFICRNKRRSVYWALKAVRVFHSGRQIPSPRRRWGVFLWDSVIGLTHVCNVHLPLLRETLLDLHLVMTEQLGSLSVEHLRTWGSEGGGEGKR